jgi:hypothetical protein
MPTMTYTILALTMAVGLVAAPAVAPAVAQADRAATVLAEARKAHRGEEKLRAVKTLEAAGAFRRSMGEMQMEGDIEILLETPDKLRRNEEMEMPGGATMARTEVLNGNDVWDDSGQRGGMGTGHGMAIVMRGPGGDLDPARMKEMQRRMRRMDLARYSLAWLLTSDAKVAHVGIAEAPDGKADVLEFTPAEGPAMKLFIDQQTHLPLMVTWQAPQPRLVMRRGGRGVTAEEAERLAREAAAETTPPPMATFEMRLAEYKKVDGLQFPHLITRAVNGQPNEEWTVKTYKVNPTFKANTFTK